MNNKNAGKTRFFALSFFVSFLIFSLIILMMMIYFHPNAAIRVADATVNDAESIWSPPLQDMLTVLFMGTYSKEDSPDIYILAKFDPVHGVVPFTVIPSQTAVTNNGKLESLSEVYDYGGALYVKNALASELGIPIDRYVRMDTASFIAAADTIGSVEFELREDIKITEGGASAVLNRGTQLLNGQKTAALMRAYYSGEEEKCLLLSRLCAEIINQRMDIVLSTVIDEVFLKIVNLIDTDISFNDFNTRKESAAYMAQSLAKPARVIALSGSWEKDGESYILSDTFLARIASELG